jgi:phage FluMu protein gp41
VAGSLLDDLDELDGSAAQQSDAGRAQILRWLTVRDDLESVRQLAERTSDDLAPLTRALEEIDSRASASVVTFERGRPRGQPRFQALAWMEPEAWWGES